MNIPTIHYPDSESFFPVTAVLSRDTVRVVIHTGTEEVTAAIYRFDDKAAACLAFMGLEKAPSLSQGSPLDHIGFWLSLRGGASEWAAKGGAA